MRELVDELPPLRRQQPLRPEQLHLEMGVPLPVRERHWDGADALLSWQRVGLSFGVLEPSF